MNLHSPTTINGENLNNNNNGDPFFEDIDSTCSTPYVSAPSSPGRAAPTTTAFFYSAPASPMHFAITSLSHHSRPSPSSCDFEFSARFGSTGSNASGSMSSADELFLNGQIRPMKLSTHLERPQVLAPLMDLEEEEEEEEEEEDENDIVVESHVVVRGRDLRSFRAKSLRRRTRSLSPLRNTPLEWTENEDNNNNNNDDDDDDVTVTNKINNDNNINNGFSEEDKSVLETTPSVSASSSRCSSAGRSSKRWVFLKDFLRSKSEGRSNNKFWSTISLSVPTKEKKAINQNQANGSSETQKSKGNSQAFASKKVFAGKPTNGVGKRRAPPSAHELHYKANRAQAEELRKKTFLPYRQGLLGCLGFSSKGYGAMNGFARALNPVSSR